MTQPAKHTPGPWVVVSTFNETRLVETQPGHSICVLADTNDAENAHLIAAAPAMYEALREIVEAIGSGEVIDYSSAGDWYTEACAALAQAEGRHHE